jgi:CO dehydrogenase/acetyl-CoA synthase gamma subunit (corrinoid Fe-S protein)
MCHRIASKLNQPQQDILQLGKSKLAMGLVLHKFLPKTNCKTCGKRTCLAFAIELAQRKCHLDECPILDQPEFAASRQALAKLLE